MSQTKDMLLGASQTRLEQRMADLNWDLEAVYDAVYDFGDVDFCMNDLSMWQSSTALPSLDLAYATACVLGVSLDWLCGRN